MLHSHRIPLVILLLSLLAPPALTAEPEVVNVWPDKAPGETKDLPPEENVTKPEDQPVGGRPIIKLTNVSRPTLTIYRPSPEKNTGAAVIICPGGGHYILAFDHEGTEVAEWLNTIGVTGIVLKYRVPARNREKRWEAAVQDAQRAIRLVRTRASEWEIDPQRIGVLGFSAGGETAGLAAILHDESQYEKVDDVDSISARPDFAALIYAGGFVEKGQTTLRPHVTVSEKTPPMFFVHAFDDNVPALNSLLLATELKTAGVPAELHLYASGGHGFGMRDTGHPCNTWPQRCEEWLQSQGWLKPPAK
jgi:acetyl esterase/lipase